MFNAFALQMVVLVQPQVACQEVCQVALVECQTWVVLQLEVVVAQLLRRWTKQSISHCGFQ